MRTQLMARVVGVALIGVGLVSCSSSNSANSPAPQSLTIESATDWFGKASELVYECQVDSKAAGDAVTTFANSPDSGETSVPIMLAAGQAIEDCIISPDSVDQLRLLSEMDPLFPEATALLRQWIDEVVLVNRALLVAAATNLDSRQLVSEAFDSQHRADELADEFEQLIARTASDLGIEGPVGELLYHWNPPGH